MEGLTRRGMLAGAAPILGAGAALLHGRIAHDHPWEREAKAAAHRGSEHAAGGGHAAFRSGRRVNHRANGFDPHKVVRDFDWGKTTRLASGRVLREWTLIA